VRRLVPAIWTLVGAVDFSAGRPRHVAVPGAPSAGRSSATRAIFPGAVVDPRDRPAWLVNVTMTPGYGRSSGPIRLASARLRAIEEGLPLVRAANNGISAVRRCLMAGRAGWIWDETGGR